MTPHELDQHTQAFRIVLRDLINQFEQKTGRQVSIGIIRVSSATHSQIERRLELELEPPAGGLT